MVFIQRRGLDVDSQIVAPETGHDDRHLRKSLGYWQLTAIGFSGVIGFGWLLGAMYAAQYAGPEAVVSWVIGGVVLALIAYALPSVSAVVFARRVPRRRAALDQVPRACRVRARDADHLLGGLARAADRAAHLAHRRAGVRVPALAGRRRMGRRAARVVAGGVPRACAADVRDRVGGLRGDKRRPGAVGL